MIGLDGQIKCHAKTERLHGLVCVSAHQSGTHLSTMGPTLFERRPRKKSPTHTLCFASYPYELILN
jgi:hypothetical protein